jgi:hypothetical protein
MRRSRAVFLVSLSILSAGAVLADEPKSEPRLPSGQVGPYVLVGNADLTRFVVLDAERHQIRVYQLWNNNQLRLLDSDDLRGERAAALPVAEKAGPAVSVPGEDIAGVPLPEQAVRTRYGSTGPKNRTVEYEVPRAPAEVWGWYRGRLEGWTIEAEEINGPHGHGSLRAYRYAGNVRETLSLRVHAVASPGGPPRSRLELSWAS